MSGSLVSRWTHILQGERKQLLAAGAGAGLAAAFAAPLASSLIVIESIERFDAPKTAITTLLAGVVAGAVAGLVFPVNPYHLIEVSEPVLTFLGPNEVFPFVGCYHFHCRQDILCAYDFVQAGILCGQVSGIRQDVLSGAGCLHHLVDAGEPDRWRRAVSAATGAERQYGNNVGACRHAVAFRLLGVLRLFQACRVVTLSPLW